ncbi:MAG: DUF3488 and transglutaminase-like domain-containing protein, partial [Gammaproteobacteria bacterium]|nr:DUF3488 and transglutaminase-like domain-containing protein [Gammaproteobacteria bacterium]
MKNLQHDSPLQRHTVGWLAALVLLAQVPHYLHLPWWISFLAALLVLFRLQGLNKPALLHSHWKTTLGVALAAGLSAFVLRYHYGYFLGRDPCVAFLFLLVSFKFVETRTTKDGTLVICLSGFLLLTQYFYAQNIISALVTLPAVLVLGGTLLNLRDSNRSETIGRSLTLTAKMLLQGLPIAAALFLLFPRLPAPLWNLPDDALAQTGLSGSMSPGTISTLSMSDDVAFRVEFDGRVPAPAQRYWRGPVLGVFDGREWTTNSSATLRPASLSIENKRSRGRPDQSSITGSTYTVTLEPHRQRWLFALDVADALPTALVSGNDIPRALGYMQINRQLIAPEPINTTLRYRQSSTLENHFVDPSPATTMNTQLAGNNIAAESFAREMRLRYPDDKAYTTAILQWFHNEPFHYTLQPDLLGDRPVDEFLFATRRGFCEHYASAFVYLLRAASIPARVVTGYLGGKMNGDYMIVRQSDAHAWAEVWIDGSWHRYDPTSAVAPERVDEGLSSSVPATDPVPALAGNSPGWLRALHLRWDALDYRWKAAVVNFNNNSQQKFWQSLGFNTP